MIINRQNLAFLTTGFKAIFQGAFDTAPSAWDRIAMTVPSNAKQEVYGWLGANTRFREWIGDRQVQNLSTHDWTIKNLQFENTISVKRIDIELDTYGMYRPVFSQLGMDAKTHPDELVFSLLKAGFNSLCYDKQYFFDTDHPVQDANGNETSVSNFGGGTGTAWYLIDTSKAVKPIIFQKVKDYAFVALDRETDDPVFWRGEYIYGADAFLNVGYALWRLAYASKQPLDEANYAAARTAMMSLTGDGGRPLNVNPTLLVVPPSLEMAALKLLNAEMIGATTNLYRNTAELLVTPWLN
ncbi:MAG: Mu-like prophage major head subunit gpT family protein [Candidatus Contendobacter sp.]